MSDLGELLVLLHGARGRISTVRATVRRWRDARLMREAIERSDRIHSGDLTVDWLADLAARLVPAPAQPPTLGT